MPGLKIDLEIIEVNGRNMVSLLAYQELQGQLQSLNTDLDQYRRNHALTDAEIAEIAKIREENRSMKMELDELAVFVREHYAQEIALGQHNVFRSLTDCIKYYLGKERQWLEAGENTLRLKVPRTAKVKVKSKAKKRRK